MKISEVVWLELPQGRNEYWIFHRHFSVPAAMQATLEIAADKDCEAWLNGELLEFSQLSDAPGTKSVTRLPVSLKAGRNDMAVTVYNLGCSNFCYDSRCRPGLAAVVYDANGAVLLKTDADWRFGRDPAFLPCGDWVTAQMGMCFCYDAGRQLPWRGSGAELPGEKALVAADYHPQYRLRDVPVLTSSASWENRIAVCGELLRVKEHATYAETCAGDFLRSRFPTVLFQTDKVLLTSSVARILDGTGLAFQPLPSGSEANGVFVTVDLGRETIGFLDLKLSAPAGTVVDVAYGEHLDDGRVRCSIDGRNFADRYICREGENHFTHRLRRWGARYLELHILSCTPEKIRLYFARLIEQSLPLPEESEFSCEDGELLKCRRIGIDTLKACMHEHYEDCPWREQALYAYDSRNQALYGYYAWGNYEFAKACFNLLGDYYLKDGNLSIVAPTATRLAIESFSFAWIAELYELYLYSGDASCFQRNRETIFRIVKAALARRDKATGLYEQSNDKEVWTFFEWVPGLDGERGWKSEDDRLHACYNAYLLEVLRCVNAMFGNCCREEADNLAKAIRRTFQAEDGGYFRTTLQGEHLHQHTQALMLWNRVLSFDADRRSSAKFFRAYREPSLVAASFSSMPYMLRAWMETTPDARKYLDGLVMREYGGMLYKNATTFWETGDGGDAFLFAGSMCHAWSSLPVFYCHRYLLGVEPLEPGFARFRVKPYPGHLTHAAGTVPTPAGAIRVRWVLRGNTVRLAVKPPQGCVPVVESYEEYPVVTVEEDSL